MPLDHLIAALEREARAEAEQLLAAARATAAADTAAVDAELTARHDTALAARAADLQTARELALTGARRVARRQVLEQRERLLERVFGAVRKQLPAALQRAEFARPFVASLEAALACFAPDEPLSVCGAASLRPLVAARVAAERLTWTDDAQVLGARIMSADGRVTVDATVDAWLAARQVELARFALDQLALAP